MFLRLLTLLFNESTVVLQHDQHKPMLIISDNAPLISESFEVSKNIIAGWFDGKQVN